MAYGFGSGVQAQLGATDYSNYLRGALAGAQMQGAGGAAIGQGIASGLGSIGGAFQQLGQYSAKGAERERNEKKQIQSAKLLAQGIEGNDLYSETIRKLANDQLKVLNDQYASPDEKLATAGAVNETMAQLINMGVMNAQMGALKATTDRNNYLKKSLEAFYGDGAPGATAAPSKPTGYGAAETTFTEGPTGRSINIGPLEPLPQATPPSETRDPIARHAAAVRLAGGDAEVIKQLDDVLKQELATTVPQVAASILQDIEAGGGGTEIPAGTPVSVYNLAIQTPQVAAAIKEARTEKRANKIAEIVQKIGSGRDVTKEYGSLPAVDREAVNDSVLKQFPERAIRSFTFEGEDFRVINGVVVPAQKMGGLDSKLLSEAIAEAGAIASEFERDKVPTSISGLSSEQMTRLNDAYIKGLKALGRKSGPDDFGKAMEDFWGQATGWWSENNGAGGMSTARIQAARQQGQAPQAAATEYNNLFKLPVGFPGSGTELNVTNVTVANPVPGQPPAAGAAGTPTVTSENQAPSEVAQQGEPKWDWLFGYEKPPSTPLEGFERYAPELLAYGPGAYELTKGGVRAAQGKSFFPTKEVIDKTVTGKRTTYTPRQVTKVPGGIKLGAASLVSELINSGFGSLQQERVNKARAERGLPPVETSTVIGFIMDALAEAARDPRSHEGIKRELLFEISKISENKNMNPDEKASKVTALRELLATVDDTTNISFGDPLYPYLQRYKATY